MGVSATHDDEDAEYRAEKQRLEQEIVKKEQEEARERAKANNWQHKYLGAGVGLVAGAAATYFSGGNVGAGLGAYAAGKGITDQIVGSDLKDPTQAQMGIQQSQMGLQALAQSYAQKQALRQQPVQQALAGYKVNPEDSSTYNSWAGGGEPMPIIDPSMSGAGAAIMKWDADTGQWVNNAPPIEGTSVSQDDFNGPMSY
jgi:hypothetical protein